MSERIYDQALMIIPGVCFECEGPAEHRHHVVPELRGGRRIVWLCENCHEKTHGFHEGIYAMMRAGRKALGERGGYTGGNRIRRKYGVVLVQVEGTWRYKPLPEEQVIIHRICKNCPNKTTYTAMARQLNLEGVSTATGAPWSKKVVRDLALRGPIDSLVR